MNLKTHWFDFTVHKKMKVIPPRAILIRNAFQILIVFLCNNFFDLSNSSQQPKTKVNFSNLGIILTFNEGQGGLILLAMLFISSWFSTWTTIIKPNSFTVTEISARNAIFSNFETFFNRRKRSMVSESTYSIQDVSTKFSENHEAEIFKS